MHLHGTKTQLRSLDSLISDNLSFMQDNADKKSAAKYNNSLHAPILSIQLNRVSPSYLHILLGIVLKHHKLLENAAHLLDTKITTLADSHLTDLDKLVKQYGGQWQQAQSLQEQLDFQYGCLVLSVRDGDTEIYRKQVEDTEHKLLQLDTRLAPRSGPIASSLGNILNKRHITPQAYQNVDLAYNADTEVEEGNDDEDDDDEGWVRNLRRFPKIPDFTLEAGLKLDVGDNPSDRDFYCLIITDEIINQWKVKTNRYARSCIDEMRQGQANLSPRSIYNKWNSVTLDEMRRFIAIMIHIGLVSKPRFTDYWSLDPALHTFICAKVMPRDRFRAILSFFSYCQQ
ncbi:PiggyBac transposable element-derived protein 4 [Plakobranchus ocellatus]|uniref:PiggyBac transposable element-derived protein 4 n=1 Tax=Plakobranchus ocellatus TaxID=259542 RepID=A0AAV4A7S3_9GAST|nr:PiggyBac transposable element-derived protein 4 [Plakobranchus ocellatus]